LHNLEFYRDYSCVATKKFIFTEVTGNKAIGYS